MIEREACLEKETIELRKEIARTRSQRGNDIGESVAWKAIISEMERKVDEAETEKLALQSEKETLANDLAKIQINFENQKALLDSTRNV